MFICDCGEACGFGEADGICFPGIFISIFCGDDDGEAVVCGMFMPGMFICWGEAFGVGDIFVAGIFIPGIFIPGMFCIPGFIVERVRDRLLLRRCLMRCVLDIFMPGIFIPGMFMPGMFAMSCFFAGFFFLVEVLFCCAAGLLIPGMFDMSCCAFASTTPTRSNPAIVRKRSVVPITLMMPLLELLYS